MVLIQKSKQRENYPWITPRTTNELFPFMTSMSSLFDEFFSNAFPEEQTDENQMMPMDVSEDDKNVIIRANMPGVNKENIRISVSNNNEIIIEGRQDEERREREENVLRYERYKGNFRRSFILPETCDLDKVDAKLQDGVLRIKIPKTEPVPAKEIKIN